MAQVGKVPRGEGNPPTDRRTLTLKARSLD